MLNDAVAAQSRIDLVLEIARDRMARGWVVTAVTPSGVTVSNGRCRRHIDPNGVSVVR